MNLHDEKWPIAVAFVVSLLGWHITQLVDEVRSAVTVLYSIDVDETKQLYTVKLENASRKKSVSNVRFLIQCPGGEACLDAAAEETKILDVPPTYSSGSPLVDDNSMQIKLSIAAGGAFGMRAKMRRGTPHPEFYFVLEPDNPSDIFILDSTSRRGQFVKHYVQIIAWSFLTLVAILMVLIAWLVRSRVAEWTQTRSTAQETEPLPAADAQQAGDAI